MLTHLLHLLFVGLQVLDFHLVLLDLGLLQKVTQRKMNDIFHTEKKKGEKEAGLCN